MSFSLQATGRVRRHWTDGAVTVAVALAALMVALASVVPARAVEVTAAADVAPGTIVVKQRERRLYLGLANGDALRYPVAVGKPGKQWRGTAFVDGKYVNPAWAPPPEVKRAEPGIPDYIAGGAPNNPMGHRALTLTGGQYAIHGTNRPWTVGQAASFGCIRMREADIDDLFERVALGTPVRMVP